MPNIFKKSAKLNTNRNMKPSVADRPKASQKSFIFKAVTESLKNYVNEQLTITDQSEKFSEHLKNLGIEPYSFLHMKSEFRRRIIITEINGRQNVVTFHTRVGHIQIQPNFV